MRKLALLSASALVLVLGVATASAQPSGQAFLTRGDVQTSTITEGRAAAIEAPAFAAGAFNLDHHAGR